jgi:uncharacterized membrane protein
MRLARVLKHAFVPDWLARRAFPARTLRRIEQAIKAATRDGAAELHFVAEAALPLHYLFRSRSSRRRAEDLFSQLRVWDTEHNNGVLIYVQLVSRHIDIVADRGVARRVEQAEWDAICREMEQAFRRGAFEEGALAAIARIGALLARHFPKEQSHAL